MASPDSAVGGQQAVIATDLRCEPRECRDLRHDDEDQRRPGADRWIVTANSGTLVHPAQGEWIHVRADCKAGSGDPIRRKQLAKIELAMIE